MTPRSTLSSVILIPVVLLSSVHAVPHPRDVETSPTTLISKRQYFDMNCPPYFPEDMVFPAWFLSFYQDPTNTCMDASCHCLTDDIRCDEDRLLGLEQYFWFTEYCRRHCVCEDRTSPNNRPKPGNKNHTAPNNQTGPSNETSSNSTGNSDPNPPSIATGAKLPNGANQAAEPFTQTQSPSVSRQDVEVCNMTDTSCSSMEIDTAAVKPPSINSLPSSKDRCGASCTHFSVCSEPCACVPNTGQSVGWWFYKGSCAPPGWP